MFIKALVNYRNTFIISWGLLLAIISISLVARLMSANAVIDNSVGIWFQGDDTDLVHYQEFNRQFGEKEWTLLLLETDSIYQPAFLRALNDITSRLEKLPNVNKVTSIANVRDNFITEQEELEYRKIASVLDFKASGPLPGQIEQFRQLLHANSLFEKNLIQRNNDKYTVVLIQNDNFLNDPSPYRVTLVDSIRHIVQQYPVIKQSSLAGTTVVNAELNRAAKHDIYIYYALISFFLILFGWLNFKNVRDLVVLFAVVLGSVIPTMGLIAFLSIPYNMITVMLPTILVSLAVAGVVHIINEFHMQNRTMPRIAAIRKTMKALWTPCFYTALTTVLGFLSLTASSVEPVFHLGIFAAFGIVLAWINSMMLAPVLLYVLWSRPKTSLKGRTPGKPLNNNKTTTASLPWLKPGTTQWPVTALLLVVLFVPITGLLSLETDTNYSRFFDDSADVTRAYDDIQRAGFAQNPLSIVIDYPPGHTFSSNKYFESVLAFEQQVNRLPQVIKSLSANELLRQVDRAFNTGHTSDLIFSQYQPQQIDQLLFLAELSGNDDIDDMLLRNKNKTRILVMTPYLSSRELAQFRNQVEELTQKYLPGDLAVSVTDTTVLWANMDHQVSQTQLYSLAGISTFLLVLFIYLFRSVRLVCVALLVNGMPLAVTLGAMGLLGGKINIATALIGGIVLGIVVDDTIHLFYKIKSLADRGMPFHQAIDRAINHVGKSIVNTTLIIAGGFACLATSSFLPSAQFGIFVTIAILIALVLDLYVVPLLLKLLYNNEEHAEVEMVDGTVVKVSSY